MHNKTLLAILFIPAILCWGMLSPARADMPAYLAPRDFTWNSLADPENVFWPGYIWMWNGPLEPEVIRSQLQDMASHDARSVWVLPMPYEFRPALENNQMDVDYLSPEFFNRVTVAVDEAARLGMNYWLYDEGGWPSGSALGQVVQTRPESVAKRMVYNGNGQWSQQNGSGPDKFDPLATATFISLTHERYAAAVGSHFGDTIKLMFTDEPAYGAASPGNSVPWTTGADTIFQNRFGYSLASNLDAFATADTAQLTTAQKQVRVDAFDFWSGQFRDAFVQPLSDWGREHGLASGGHFGGEDITMGAVNYGFGSITRQLRAMDVPGIDTIYRQIFPGQTTENNFPKFASSVAHQNGTALVVSESFCVAGNGLTPAQMKWVTDYERVRGVTQQVNGCYPLSTEDHLMTGQRGHFGTVNPLWDFLPDLHRYTARVDYVLASGRPGIDTALYYPVRDVWANGKSNDPAILGFNTLTQSLLQRQCDYDVIDDDILNDPATRVENGRLVLGAMSYRTIVVGPTQWMSDAAQQRLEAFETAGGEVIRINDVGQINTAIADIAPTVGLSVPSSGMRVVKRTWDGGGAAFFFNEGQTAYNGIALLDLAGTYYSVDPATGMTRSLNVTGFGSGLSGVSLNLAAGESMLLVAQPPQDLPADLKPAKQAVTESIALADGWTARVDRQYVVGEHNYEIHETVNPQFQAVTLGRWAATLGIGEDFSGHVTYRKTVAIPESFRGEQMLLELGELEYAARVLVDGQEVGNVLWGPWCIELPLLGDQTEFTLDIEMSNTLANEITSQRVRDFWTGMSGAGWPSEYNAAAWGFEADSRGGGLLGPVSLHLGGLLTPEIEPLTFITPINVAAHSGTEPAPYTADKIIDGIYGAGGVRNIGAFTDDSDPTGSGTYYTVPITGHIILDLGKKTAVSALKLWSRGDSSESFLPQSMDIFYFADGDWSNNVLIDDIEGDADIISIWSGTLEDLVLGDDQTIDFGSPIAARYIGIRVNSSFGWDSFQIGEVAFKLSFLPGDANLDGTVDNADAAILASNWLSSAAAWAQGDFNADGKVNDLDAAILASNWQATVQGSNSAPEPSAIALLLCGLMVLCQSRL